jgi:Xaa-Pro aminopeptidase
MLVLEPANFAWLTSGASAVALDPEDAPALYCTPEARWLVARNTDAQRLFDEELDGLGFQLKEWPWYGGRAAMLDHLCRLRPFACDRPMDAAPLVAEQLRQRRLALTACEAEKFLELGRTVSHALEAACRSVAVGQTEQEVAGQVAHRLTHRGVETVAVEVAADGRSRRYRRVGFTAAKVEQYAVLRATGRRFGLYATASRTVSFGPPDEMLAREHDAACKITAAYVAGTAPDGIVKELLVAGRRIFKITGFEHEWRLRPLGHVTGRAVVERSWLPDTADVLQPGWGVTWQASVGAASSCDTYLVTPEGPKFITMAHGHWPQKRIRIQGGNIARPDVLQR